MNIQSNKDCKQLHLIITSSDPTKADKQPNKGGNIFIISQLNLISSHLAAHIFGIKTFSSFFLRSSIFIFLSDINTNTHHVFVQNPLKTLLLHHETTAQTHHPKHTPFSPIPNSHSSLPLLFNYRFHRSGSLCSSRTHKAAREATRGGSRYRLGRVQVHERFGF